jgi:hypothetical protein
MNPLRNKFVVVALGVVALAMLVNSFRPMWQRRRPPARTTSAPAQPRAAAPASAQTASNAPAQSATQQQAETALPAPGIELSRVGWNFNGAPRHDPFQIIGPAPTNWARLYPSATELLTLRAVWWQSGTILADINNRVVREGATIKASKGALSADFKILNIGAERIWVEGPNGEEQVRFDPTLSLGNVNLKLGDGTANDFALLKTRLDWPYRVVNGVTNNTHADTGWLTFRGKVVRQLEDGKYLVKDMSQEPLVILKNVPLNLVDDEGLEPIRCQEVGTESYMDVNQAKATVRLYDFGVPCSPPKGVIDVLKNRKETILQQHREANERRVTIEVQEAEKGDATAQYMLGRRYLYGDGVPKNEQEAHHWLQAAATQGNADALAKLQTLAAQK